MLRVFGFAVSLHDYLHSFLTGCGATPVVSLSFHHVFGLKQQNRVLEDITLLSLQFNYK